MLDCSPRWTFELSCHCHGSPAVTSPTQHSYTEAYASTHTRQLPYIGANFARGPAAAGIRSW